MKKWIIIFLILLISIPSMSLGKVNYNYQSSSTSFPLELDPFWKDYEMQLNGVKVYYFTFYTEEFNYSLEDLDKRIRETVEKEGYIYDEDFHYPLVEPYSISSHFNSNDYGVINSFSVQYNRKYLVTTFYIDIIYILDEGEIRFDKPYGPHSISNSFHLTSKINKIIQHCISDEFKDKLGKNVWEGMTYSPTLVYADYFCIKKKETDESTWWIRNYSYDHEIENKFNNQVLSFFIEEEDRDYVIKNILYYDSEDSPYYYLNRTDISIEPRRIILISNQYKENILDVSNNYAKIISNFYNDYDMLLRQNNRLEEIEDLYQNILYASDNLTEDVYKQALADLNQYSYNLDEYQKEEDNYKKAAHFFGMDEIVEKADEYYLKQRNIIQRSYDRHSIAQNNANSKLNQNILFINLILLIVTIFLLVFTITISVYDLHVKSKDKEKYKKYILLYRNKKIKGKPLFSLLRKN